MSTGIFFQDQVRQSFNKVIDTVYPDRFIMQGLANSLKDGQGSSEGILNFKTDLDHFRKEFYFDTFTSAGMAEYYTHCGDKIPQVTMSGDRLTGKQEAIAIGFEWCEDELLLAQAENTGLIEKAMVAMKRGTDQKLEESYWVGNAALGFYGLLNFPNVSVQNLQADGTGASTTIASKTPDQKYRDLVRMSLAVSETSKNAFSASVLLLPLSVYNDVNNTIFSNATDTAATILTVFLQNQANNPLGIKAVRPICELDGAGTVEGGKAVVYSMDAANQEAVLSQYFRIKNNNGGEEVNGKYSSYALSTTGGVIVYAPLALAVFDNV